MNRAALLASLAGLALPYTGAPELVAVKAWLAATNTEVIGEDGKPIDIDAAWNAKASIKVGGTGGGSGDSPEIKQLRAEMKALQEKQRLGVGNPRLAAAEHTGSLLDGSLDPSLKGERPVKWHAVASRKAYNKRANAGATVFPDSDIADVVGAYARLGLAKSAGVGDYPQKLADVDILKAAQVEYDDSLGGALVPQEFSSYFSDIKDRFSNIRSWVRTEPMNRDSQSFPRRSSGTTVYVVGETAAITVSTMGTQGVTVTAKKLGQLVQVSNELQADNAYNFGEKLAREMAYQFAKFEERQVLVGDGTSTYGGVLGLTQALKGLSATIANIAGLYVGTGNAYSELTLPDFEGVLGRFPDLEGGTNEPAWVVHRRFYFEVMVKLAYAAGGVTSTEILNGKPTPMFLGYPVRFSNAMPRTEANSQVCALFGDGTLAAVIGDRQDTRIDTSDQRYFDQDMVAFRGTQRSGVTVYEVGNASATEASRTPGPVVGLITAAS